MSYIPYTKSQKPCNHGLFGHFELILFLVVRVWILPHIASSEQAKIRKHRSPAARSGRDGVSGLSGAFRAVSIG